MSMYRKIFVIILFSLQTDLSFASNNSQQKNVEEILSKTILAHTFSFLPKGKDIFTCREVSKKMRAAVKLYWNNGQNHILKISEAATLNNVFERIPTMGLIIKRLDISRFKFQPNEKDMTSNLGLIHSKLPDIEYINISNRRLLTSGFNFICENFTNLSELHARCTIIFDDGDALTNIKNLGKLTYLDISGNGLLPIALQQLSHNTHLQQLDISENYAVEELPKLSNLKKIYIKGTKLDKIKLKKLYRDESEIID